MKSKKKREINATSTTFFTTNLTGNFDWKGEKVGEQKMVGGWKSERIKNI